MSKKHRKDNKKQPKKTSAVMSREDTKIELAKLFKNVVANERFIKKVSNLLPLFTKAKGQEKKKIGSELDEIITKLWMSDGLDNNFPLMRICGEFYGPLAIKCNERLIKEYDCQNAGEKALAQTIANAYVRILEYTSIMHGCREIEYLTSEKNNYYRMISKELDRAQRHFHNGLAMLKQFKSPAWDINIRAKTAFIAQNQQINADKNNHYEKIDPK